MDEKSRMILIILTDSAKAGVQDERVVVFVFPICHFDSSTQ
jgi:hypothetical protein